MQIAVLGERRLVKLCVHWVSIFSLSFMICMIHWAAACAQQHVAVLVKVKQKNFLQPLEHYR